MRMRYRQWTTRGAWHVARLRAAATDAGYSVTEWVFITAAGGTVAAVIYAAISDTAARKIATIVGL